jgi:hypothetical protein
MSRQQVMYQSFCWEIRWTPHDVAAAMQKLAVNLLINLPRTAQQDSRVKVVVQVVWNLRGRMPSGSFGLELLGDVSVANDERSIGAWPIQDV